MTDDIVARLRESDGGYFMRKMFAEAADEIERLREALRVEQEELAACFIDRKETQRERDEARCERDGYLDGNRMTLKALAEANEIARKYKAERDEARRLYINEMCLRDYGDTSARIREAKARGWNCFDSDGWSDPGDECQREAL